MTPNLNIKPDMKLSVKQTFGIDSDMEVDAFSKKNEFVPEIDKDYKFDRDTTLAILAGFKYNKRVIVHGYHGTGKSTHITNVAARLNWLFILELSNSSFRALFHKTLKKLSDELKLCVGLCQFISDLIKS